jgi:hypothetical protein
MLNTNQIKALSDAQACSGQGQRGLERQSGRRWVASNDNFYAFGHAHQTICSLVNLGYLRLWCRESVAHITDSGREALESYNSKV